MRVQEALEHLQAEEQARLVDMESVGRMAIQRVEHVVAVTATLVAFALVIVVIVMA